jgi:DNA adenine methylase Dam
MSLTVIIKIRIFLKKKYALLQKRLNATFICASYDETLALLQAGDVVYCDPPYDGTFSGYHTAGFTEDDQYHLASILERRSSEGHPVIVSNSDTSLTRSLYRNFTRHRITAKRSMGVAAGESKSAEKSSPQNQQLVWCRFCLVQISRWKLRCGRGSE